MTKLFKRLIAELRRLGLSIVHANFNRIVIDTGKHDPAAATEHVNFVLTALHTKPLFHILQVDIKDIMWEQLLWLGPENYGGIEVPQFIEGEDADERTRKRGYYYPTLQQTFKLRRHCIASTYD